jgi:hypothetical protein
MIPGYVGDNIQATLGNGNGNGFSTQWRSLPKSVSRYGQNPEEIFANYAELEDRYGKERMKDMPLGAIAMYTFADKLKVGLSQLMAGARSFRIDTLKRPDLVALTEECAKISGISYVMDAYKEEAEQILNS